MELMLTLAHGGKVDPALAGASTVWLNQILTHE